MKKVKTVTNAHTSKSKIGMGDNYGSGVRNPVGRMRESSMGDNYLSPKKLGKPPKSLA